MVIHCDNQVVVSVLRSGHTRDMTLAAISRNISMITAYLDIELITVYIEEKLNVIADTLSRLSINSSLMSKIPALVPDHLWITRKADVLHTRLVYLIAGANPHLTIFYHKAARRIHQAFA